MKPALQVERLGEPVGCGERRAAVDGERPVGEPHDEQLRIDALNGWSSPDPEETAKLLGSFYDKTDKGRAG